MYGIENGIWQEVFFGSGVGKGGKQETVLRNCFSSEPGAVLWLRAESGVCALLSFVLKTRRRERFGSHGFGEGGISVRNEGRRWSLYMLYIFSCGRWGRLGGHSL